jgi:hypothetical protein
MYLIRVNEHYSREFGAYAMYLFYINDNLVETSKRKKLDFFSALRIEYNLFNDNINKYNL